MNIPDHELVCQVGQGSYGEVWLVRNVMGRYRAAKFIFRKTFKDPHPFQRELAGIQKFEPISRSHPGFVHVLHVGRNEAEDYFYYLMEAADDVSSGQQIDPARYEPKTLTTEIRRLGKLPLEDAIKLAKALTSALVHLHAKNLVHRDIKPSNIVFVDGAPKLADIGLVAAISEARSFVGTEGFIPPEGPGSPQADVYSLGKVLYEAATGLDRQQFPEFPTSFGNSEDAKQFLEFNEVILKACDPQLEGRYRSAETMLEELSLLESGGSLRTRRKRRQLLITGLKVAAVVGVAAAVIGSSTFLVHRKRTVAEENRREDIRSSLGKGALALDQELFLKALPEFVKALRLEESDPRRAQTHRMRIAMVLASSPRLARMWFLPRAVKHVEFSPGDETLLVASDKIELMGVASGKSIRPRFGPPGLVDACFSQDGQTILASSSEGHASLWSVEGLELRQFAHPGEVRAARFSHSGNSFISACRDGTARIWNLADGTALELKGHRDGLLFAAFSPDDALAVTCGQDGRAQLWDAKTGAQIGQPMRHSLAVYHASFSPDGKRLITSSLDHKARIWRVPSGEDTSGVISLSAPAQACEFSPDGRTIITASLTPEAELWNADTVTPARNHMLRSSGPVTSACFASDSRRVALASNDGTVRIWDLAEKQMTARRLAGGSSWSARDFDLVHPKRSSFPLAAFMSNAVEISQSPNLRRISATKLISGKPVWEVELPAANFLSNVEVSDDGSRLAAVWSDAIQVFRTDGSREPVQMSFSGVIGALAFDRSGEYLAAAVKDQVSIRDTKGKETLNIKLPAPHHHLFFSPDGTALLTCLRAAPPEGRSPMEGDTPEKMVKSPQRAHAEKEAATSDYEKHAAMLWNVKTGEPLGQPFAHDHQVSGGYASGDGRSLLTVNLDRRARVCDPLNGHQISSYMDGDWKFTSVVIGNDGLSMAGIKGSGAQVLLWNVPVDDRPMKDLEMLDQLLTGDSIGKTNRQGHMKMLWDTLRPKYAADFEVNANQAAEWHEAQAGSAEYEKDWAGALFHWRRVAALRPENPVIPRRIQALEKERP